MNNNINFKLPRILAKAYDVKIILSVILFGSSLHNSSTSNDVDIAVITRRGRFDDFVKLLSKDDSLKNYDVSLIKREEIDYTKKFKFGGHGEYLVESLRDGEILIGKNFFTKFPPTKIKNIKTSIVDRMREYIYVLRKSYFDKNAENKFFLRYNKMMKLSAFLLIDNYIYPQILNKDIIDIEKDLIKHGFIITENKKKNIEDLWTKIIEQYS
jgi:hypothetical protein